MAQNAAQGIFLRFQGTEDNLEELRNDFINRLGENAVHASEPTPPKRSFLDDDDLGQQELIDVVIQFSSSLASGIIAMIVHDVINDFKHRHPSTKISVETKASETKMQAPGDNKL